MKGYLVASVTCTVFTAISCCDIVSLTFPEGFLIGAASSAYQIEGAWNVSGKGVSNCDWSTHNHPESIKDHSNGDIACNSYYKYEEDVQWIKSLGLDFYRFSIAWTRILPTGFGNVISNEGLQYYKNLTAALIANGIRPVVTMSHFDHPQIIEEMGGWTNELIVDWFVTYARILFKELGDSVKTWITINEPDSFCPFTYGDAGVYFCGHNMLKAHAKVYRMYDEEFRSTQQGTVSIVLPCVGSLAADSSDTESEDTAFQFNCGWIGHPIYVGDYPEIMKTRIANRSAAQGYPRSRLPTFTNEWLSMIKGSSDYLGVNHYTTKLVSPDPDEKLGIYNSDSGLIYSVDSSWPQSPVNTGFYIYPQGFGDLLRKIRDEFNNPPVWIMENGYPDGGEQEDYTRISYFYGYLRELLIAVKRDGCNVVGYAIWSIMDNFEWWSGYTEKYGIISVDFDDPDRTRSSKLSTYWWKHVLANRKLLAVPPPSNK